MASFVAATVEFEGENPLLAEAMNIGTKGDSKKDDDSVKRAEPSEGSFENFMQTFGSPARWAGSN